MATQTAQTSRYLQSRLSEAGLQGSLQANAFKTLLQYVLEVQADADVLHEIMEQLKQNMNDEGSIDDIQVEAAIRQLAGCSISAPEAVTIIDAFNMPRVRFDNIHKRLVEDNIGPTSLQAPAEAKVKLYQQRFSMLYQRLRRDHRFAPLNAVQATLPNLPHVNLTELTGLKGNVGKRCFVMGLISSQEDGQCTLEDQGAVVPIDLSNASVAGGLVTENCIVVAEGEMGLDGVFKICALGFPSCEKRIDLPVTAQKLNFFGAPMLTPEQQTNLEVEELNHQEERIVFLANVWLDKPETFETLHVLLGGFESAGLIPAMLVLMGNFSARATSAILDADYLGLKEGFNNLARLIDTYAIIKEQTRFVFVPGPADPGLGQLLPQPRLPTYFTHELQAVLPKAVFATNPCRIKYFTKEIVVFRYDLMKHMRRRCLVPVPDNVTNNPEALFSQLATTVLQQSCLCPLPLVVQPVHWAHQQALQLYPLPHAVVIADASPQASITHEGCTIFNPGCLQERLFSAYMPLQDEVEPSILPSGAEDDHEDCAETNEEV